jgi:hypothetical protein
MVRSKATKFLYPILDEMDVSTYGCSENGCNILEEIDANDGNSVIRRALACPKVSHDRRVTVFHLNRECVGEETSLARYVANLHHDLLLIFVFCRSQMSSFDRQKKAHTRVQL